MNTQFTRTQMLLGQEAMERLAASRVAVFGIGGVGGYVCEALVRSGIGAFDLIDHDTVDVTNLNRQIIATWKTVGRLKVDVMRERMLDINPEVKVRTFPSFFLPENADQFPFEEYDYVVDAVDTVTAKIELILRAKQAGIPVISAMGAGNKLEAGGFCAADIYETKGCPLARVMRRELKKRDVKSLKVVYSPEEPLQPLKEFSGEGSSVTEPAESAAVPEEPKTGRRRAVPGSTAFAPAVCGMLIAGEIVKDLTAGTSGRRMLP